MINRQLHAFSCNLGIIAPKWLSCTRLRLVQLPSHFLVQLDIRTRNKLLVTEHGPWQLPALNVEQLLGTLVHPYGKPFVTFTSQDRATSTQSGCILRRLLHNVERDIDVW